MVWRALFFNLGAPLCGYAKGITPWSTALAQKGSHMVVNKACEEFCSRGSTRSAFDLAAATFEPVGVSNENAHSCDAFII